MSFDSNTKLWDLETGKELITLRGHAGFVYSGIFSAYGRQLITAGLDGTVRFWDGTGGQRDARALPRRRPISRRSRSDQMAIGSPGSVASQQVRDSLGFGMLCRTSRFS